MSDRNCDETTLAMLDRRLAALGLERYWTGPLLMGVMALYRDRTGAFAMTYLRGGSADRPNIRLCRVVALAGATLDDQIETLRLHLDQTRAAAAARRPPR